MIMYAVYKEINNENKLCQCWNEANPVAMPAIFYFSSDAFQFVKEMQSVKGNEIYKYNVVGVDLTNNCF